MAVTDCEELSNIISLGIIAWDEELAKEIGLLSATKKDALIRAWKLREEEWVDALTWLTAHELELKASSADIEMRAIVQAKILSDEVRSADAYRELAQQIKATWWTIAWGVDLLEKLRNASPADFEDIAKQWWGKYADDPARAITEMKQAIAETISANYSIRQYSEFMSDKISSLKKQLRNKEISNGVFEDEMAKAHKEAMQQIAKWENPKGFVKLDPEWAAIKKVFWDDPISAGKVWSQFIMARELLSDWGIDDWILKAFKKMWAKNLTWDLTLDQIAKYWKNDLDKLLARAYTNTEQLYRDWELRLRYREKLIELTSWMRVSKENLSKARSILNTMEFAEKWATFSNVVTADNAARSARKRWFKVSDWTSVVNWIKWLSKKMWEDPDIFKKPIKIAGAEMQPLDVIQIIYDITWDENIIRLLRLWFIDDGTVLSVATTSLLWASNQESAERILKLFSKATENPKVSNIRDTTLLAITWSDIKEWAPIWFYDFREWLYIKDELNRSKADYFDKLAEKNKMKVDSSGINEIKSTDDVNTLITELSKYKWGYIITNDSQWRTNSTLSKAIDTINKDLKDEEKIWVIFPRWWMSSSFVMENWQLYFKTLDDKVFDNIAWTISIQTLWEARPTREILATAFEAGTGKNADKLRYQASYTKWAVDADGRVISDQQHEYFLNSKARDENWNLIKFYHWTNAKFDTFDIDASRKSSDIQWMFFSEWEDEARWYWKNIIECYLDIRNPVPAHIAYDTVWKKYAWQTNAWVLAREELQRMWYDWVQGFQWEWIVFSPEQIKYVDNRVPTASTDMRFQERVPDYSNATYTKWTVDNLGREISDQQNEYFQHSVVRDENWNLIEVYHWPRNAGFTVFDSRAWKSKFWRYKFWDNNVIYFSSSEATAGTYKENWWDESYKCYLNITNPFVVDAGWKTFSHLQSGEILKKQRNEYNKFKKKRDKTWKKISSNLEELNDDLAWFNYELKENADWYYDLVYKWDNSKFWFPEVHIPSLDTVDELFENWAREYLVFTKDKEFDTDTVVRWVLKMNQDWANYDWIIFKNIVDVGPNWSVFEPGVMEPTTNYVVFNSNQAKNVDNRLPTTSPDITLQPRLNKYANQADVTPTNAMKVEMFTKDRTWQQIADAYWFDVRLVQWNMIEWVAAYWAYWNWLIYFTDLVKESTAPHELFHAIFDLVDQPTKEKILKDAEKLFGYNADTAEEVLANAFAEWFKTWKLTYWKVPANKQKTFMKKVTQFFKDVAEWLWLLDSHRAQVGQMFNDMVNLKYLPDAWKNVNATEAMIKYNKELNEAAARYYWEMLWQETPKTISSEYISNIQTLLSDRLWMDIKAFTEIENQSALWQRVNQQFSLEKLTTWKYDKQIIDINTVKDNIASLSDEELERDIKNELWDVLIKWTVKWNPNIDHIREAYLDYKTAGSAIDSLTAKWKIVSLANGWSAATMSMNDIRKMFSEWTFEQTYKKLFLSNQTLSKKDMDDFVSAINNNIFDILSISFAENLVSAWYALPLINMKEFVYDYLRGRLDLNNKFIESFLYKNNIPFSQDWLKTLVDNLMPAELRFDYENSLFKGRFGELEQWEKSVFVETKNKFLPDSYSAIASIEMARFWKTPYNEEKNILEWILDEYVTKVSEWVKAWTLTFKEAEELKQEAWYALDMFEQDFLLPRYGRFLSKQEKQQLLWMKYALPIWIKWQNPDDVWDELNSIRNTLINKYDTMIWWAAKNNEINASILKWIKWEDAKMQKAIDERRNQLIEGGWIIKEVNWQYIVYDVKQALELTIDSLPDNISWLEWLKALWKDWIEQLSNKQAYALLRYLEAAKWLNATANYVTDILYKQNPKLLECNFFETYKIWDNWLPRVLEWNILNADKFLSQFDNIAWLDNTAKKNIFDKIVNKFRKQWYVTTQDLDKIIKDWVEEAQSTFRELHFTPKQREEAKNRMILVYQKAFNPYTYVRDIPKWWMLIDWKTPIRNVKKKVVDTIKMQYNQAIDDLKATWIVDTDNIQWAIYIQMNDWTKLSLKDVAEMDIDSWKKSIFNDESVFVAWADELKRFEGSPDDAKLVEQQKEWRNNIVSQYESTLQSLLNQTQYISKAEADLMTSFMFDVRTTMRKYTLTSKVVDALDALGWLNEEAARWIKDYLIGFTWNVSFWKLGSKQIKDRLKLVQEAYKKYYTMDITKLNSIKPTTRAEDLALRLTKYFKNLERLLGSADWLTWCTTSAQLNRAFYRLWETVMNIDTVKWVFSLLSWVEQNQVLKFFKFAKWDLRKNANVFVRSGREWFSEWVGWYRDYVEDIVWITRDEFNEIFASNFSEGEFKRILQWLTGFTLTWSWWRMWTRILNVLNSSNFLMRFLMSYPWQLLTIPQQSLAYFLKQIWFERELWMESLSDVDAVRAHYWVLDWAYNELLNIWKSNVSPDDLRVDSYYNRYWIPDVEWIYKTSPIETSDDYINMYAKIDNHAASSISATRNWFRLLDPYKDNANNIIDWLFARNFKNISFLKAIRNNDYMHFTSAKEFMSFMDDPNISAEVKTRLMDRVTAYSGRNFRNILWLWFGWIDRAVGWSWFWNIMYWLMQLINFRWSWWQNIFKQSWAAILTWLKMLRSNKLFLSREGREMVAEYIAKQPEFQNFVWALFNDLKWTWKLQRFQDNWRWPDEEDFYDFMDFVEYMTDTLNMTSQWFQWLQSFWPLRPIWEWMASAFASHMDPTIYKDTYGIWAFFNALGKNVWRQWKPYNWIAKWIWAWTTDWRDWAWTYAQNEFWKLSFGSLRYMVNEDQNAYGYTYEMSWQEWGIPSILMWESKLGSDKNFSYEIDNTETWETLKQVFGSDIPWDDKWVYIWNLGKAFVNWSQLLSVPKNVIKAIKRESSSYFTADDLADYMQNTSAWKEFYQKWIVTPKTPEEAELFFNTMLKNAQYRPWSSSFTKSLVNYEDYWHMDWKNGKKADAEMELWLSHMKYLTNEHWEFKTSEWERIIDPSWTKLIADVRAHWYDQTYTTSLIYNYSKSRLNNHSSDPNYQLYVKMLWQWQAHNLIEYQIDQIQEVLNKGKKWADNKWSEKELEDTWIERNLLLQLWNSVLPWDTMTFFDRLQVLDEDDATVAALQIIQKQATKEDRKVLDRFFDVEENDDWSKSVSLKYNYEQTLKQIWAVAKAIDAGNTDLAVAEASTLINMYQSKDPTWVVTATIIDSVYNRIYDTDSLSPEQKQAAMIALFHKNKDFVQRNPEKLREMLWDDYDTYADYMNQMLYQRDWMVISNLESIQTSWKGSSSSTKAGNWFSSALKNLASKLWGSSSSRWVRSTANNKQRVPVVIKWSDLVKELWLKGYTPSSIKVKINSIEPDVDLSIAKDVNRKVSWPKTEAISTKKQLSNIEQKVTKALEAEN